jgi:hypothetical protein
MLDDHFMKTVCLYIIFQFKRGIFYQKNIIFIVPMVTENSNKCNIILIWRSEIHEKNILKCDKEKNIIFASTNTIVLLIKNFGDKCNINIGTLGVLAKRFDDNEAFISK